MSEANLPRQRYIVLLVLDAVDHGALNEMDINRQLDLHGYRLDREQVRAILDWLEARKAIRQETVGGVTVIAEIAAHGKKHLDRRGGVTIEGVHVPERT